MNFTLYVMEVVHMQECPDPVRRLRQHNSEIKGGATYHCKGPGWTHVLGFGFEKSRHNLRSLGNK